MNRVSPLCLFAAWAGLGVPGLAMAQPASLIEYDGFVEYAEFFDSYLGATVSGPESASVAPAPWPVPGGPALESPRISAGIWLDDAGANYPQADQQRLNLGEQALLLNWSLPNPENDFLGPLPPGAYRFSVSSGCRIWANPGWVTSIFSCFGDPALLPTGVEAAYDGVRLEAGVNGQAVPYWHDAVFHVMPSGISLGAAGTAGTDIELTLAGAGGAISAGLWTPQGELLGWRDTGLVADPEVTTLRLAPGRYVLGVSSSGASYPDGFSVTRDPSAPGAQAEVTIGSARIAGLAVAPGGSGSANGLRYLHFSVLPEHVRTGVVFEAGEAVSIEAREVGGGLPRVQSRAGFGVWDETGGLVWSGGAIVGGFERDSVTLTGLEAGRYFVGASREVLRTDRAFLPDGFESYLPNQYRHGFDVEPKFSDLYYAPDNRPFEVLIDGKSWIASQSRLATETTTTHAGSDTGPFSSPWARPDFLSFVVLPDVARTDLGVLGTAGDTVRVQGLTSPWPISMVVWRLADAAVVATAQIITDLDDLEAGRYLVAVSPALLGPGAGFDLVVGAAPPSMFGDVTGTLLVQNLSAGPVGVVDLSFPANDLDGVRYAEFTIDPVPPCSGADIAAPFGVVDEGDIEAFIARVDGAPPGDPGADFDGNGVVDFFDVLAFLRVADEGCP